MIFVSFGLAKLSNVASFILFFFLILCFPHWKDNEGQTPLHYAAVCEREAIAEFLVKQNADTNLEDNDGKSARDLCEVDWPCLRH